MRDVFSDLRITIVKRIRTTTVLEGESCRFECVLSHEIIDEASWILNGQLIVSNGRIIVANKGCKYKISIQEVTISDAGEVIFTIKELSCRTMLFVKGETPYYLNIAHFTSITSTFSVSFVLREACESF